MKRLRGKKIVLGISAGIAAYKIPSLVRLLKKEGASVRVILTPDAHAFVTPLTLSVLSQEAVLSSFVSEDTDNPVWNDHVALGNWADLMLIAPATANSLSAMAHAKCNNFLIATYLSARCPVMIAPAMDLDMYAHPANQKNIETLETYGNIVLPVGDGALASGLEGKGRMLEPQEILEHTIHHFYSQQPLLGKKVLITAGPTYEPIDPVRFIGNFSSGKMGYALAHQAADLGAEVHLILGPHSLDTDEAPFTIEEINTADEMHAAVFNRYHMMDFAIAAAAVADFKPRTLASQKIKKEIGTPAIELIPNPDILAQMGEQKKNQVLIGFALETENEVAHATNKLKRKNLDAIILNSLADAGAGFATDTNKITYIGKNEAPKSFSLKSKEEVAKDIWNEILT
ncbi:MAG: bifunctional phosphopantothenoylcysteine decarboxylase/phosphopantothenate--cysteine ligase CoaBC [Flavobacteriales bacterium]|nr:bifunctional phosphopantothenoylcysteine decarboxylase/phosphopantothenate--cysteine ligase CoaBC [Flavobacteriales bacterium]